MPNAFAISSVPRSAPSLRLLTPLIEPDVRVSRIRLSDRSHAAAHGFDVDCGVRAPRAYHLRHPSSFLGSLQALDGFPGLRQSLALVSSESILK